MIDTKKLIECFKDRKVKADLVSDSNGEIQLRITTIVADYIVAIIEFDDYIELNGNVCSIRDEELYHHIQSVIDDDKFNYWTGATDLDVTYEDLADEIINYVDDGSTVKAIKDLNKFISYVEKLKATYEDTDIPICNLLSEIIRDYE